MRRTWLLVIFSTVYLGLIVRVLWRVGDEGLVVYGAQRVLEGALPYRDFFEVFGPAAFYWPALFLFLFGTSWIVVRGLLLATGVATAAVVHWMTRRLYRGRFELAPAVFVLMMGIPLRPALSYHWDGNLFALLAVAAFLLWQDRRSDRYLVLSGALAGITSCFLQQEGLLLLAGLWTAAFFRLRLRPEPGRSFGSRTAGLLAGYAVVGGAVVAYFAARGGLHDLLYSTVVWPLSRYRHINTVPYGYGVFQLHWPYWQAILRQLVPPWARYAVGGLIVVPFLVVLSLPVLLPVLAVAAWRYGAGRARIFQVDAIPYWCAGVALWVSQLYRPDAYHLVLGSPLLLILAFGAWTARFDQPAGWRAFPPLFVTACVLLLGTFHGVIAASARNRLETRRGTVASLAPDGALEYLMQHTRPGEPVFVYPYYSMYYFLANVENPTRYDNLVYGYQTDDQFRDAIADLERAKVRVVLWDLSVAGPNLKRWFPRYEEPPEDRRPMERYLRTHYRLVGIENGFRILRRRRDASSPGDSRRSRPRRTARVSGAPPPHWIPCLGRRQPGVLPAHPAVNRRNRLSAPGA